MKILIVDDEEAIRVSLGGLLGKEGHEVRLAEHAPQALELLEEEGADLVITDLSMPSVDGLELFDLVRARRADQLVVLMTAFGDERTAVRALKQGLYDYVPKPFGNDEILAVVQRASEVLALRKENTGLFAELTGPFHGLIGRSPSMQAVYELIKKAGPTTASVLITGESGTVRPSARCNSMPPQPARIKVVAAMAHVGLSPIISISAPIRLTLVSVTLSSRTPPSGRPVIPFRTNIQRRRAPMKSRQSI